MSACIIKDTKYLPTYVKLAVSFLWLNRYLFDLIRFNLGDRRLLSSSFPGHKNVHLNSKIIIGPTRILLASIGPIQQKVFCYTDPPVEA